MPVETAIAYQPDRSLSPRAVGGFAKALADSGVVDDIQTWDQLTSWWPRGLWSPANTAVAAFTPDCDSFPDAFSIASFASALEPRLGVNISTDACRRGPAELLQTMLTLASATEGRARVLVGAGEAKQLHPFGLDRSKGLARLEDLLKIWRLLLTCDEPINYDGRLLTLRDAWIGGVRTHQPEIWALGAGPKLISMAGAYADGFSTMVPMAFATPEALHAEVTKLKTEVERNDRDPDAFHIGIWIPAIIHDDSDVIERAYRNPLIQWISAGFGRLNQSDWDNENIEPIYPRDWHYALKLLPASVGLAEAEKVCGQVSREMVAKSWFSGSPSAVADQIRPFIEAGATWVSIGDMAPLVLPPEEAATALQSSIAVCAELKKS